MHIARYWMPWLVLYIWWCQPVLVSTSAWSGHYSTHCTLVTTHSRHHRWPTHTTTPHCTHQFSLCMWSHVPEVCGDIRFTPLAWPCRRWLRVCTHRRNRDQATCSWSESPTDPRLVHGANCLTRSRRGLLLMSVVGRVKLSSDCCPCQDSNPRPTELRPFPVAIRKWMLSVIWDDLATKLLMQTCKGTFSISGA